jgi:hypothetical protein
MEKIMWIAERFYTDIKKGFPFLTFYGAVLVGFIVFGKILSYYDLMEFYLPVSILVFCLGGIYGWYSIEWDWQRKKIVDKLKGKR